MGARIKVVLACEVCGRRNYRTTRSSTPGTKGVRMKKFCVGCNAHTMHAESH
ncbi:MAG: 50S ribosomal protein L33 [Deltaproteobacteria bacterium]|jgi:large subunit ribosomal protein L33|nr:50S ribosomal protein L33 [Deltaproteobacteria bacterium]MBK7064185.1 50S ribosomal protein L33 [Deltaproteobacteria bacterium]MBK8693342.1 50S ribosomal protein L33 [Deltaproteobacteria bacterium]TAK26399.1 MAG: 50S ribosomal protein L33 [Myxococcaceae bacterium]